MSLKTFKKFLSNLLNEELFVLGEMPYSCSLCNKSFTFQQSYHKHMLYHSSEKPYSCNECGRAFKELSTLQNHARIHSGERPFTCETCGKLYDAQIKRNILFFRFILMKVHLKIFFNGNFKTTKLQCS